MSQETEAKFLSKRQTKRNLEKYVQSLLVECNWNQADSSTSEVLSQPCTSRSITNTHLNLDHLDLNQNLDLNSDLLLKLNTQEQRCRNKELVHEIPDVLEEPEKLHNITSEVFEKSEVTEKYNSDSETLPNTLQDKLKYWALAHNITLSALDDLLSVLKVFHPDIPLSGRSLLHTPRTTKSIHLHNGKFTYFGICNQLNPLLQKEPYSKILDFNFDGLLLFKSNSIGVWLTFYYMPILFFSATVKSVEPNAAINLIKNSIKDWLKLASVRTTLTKTRKLKKKPFSNNRLSFCLLIKKKSCNICVERLFFILIIFYLVVAAQNLIIFLLALYYFY